MMDDASAYRTAPRRLRAFGVLVMMAIFLTSALFEMGGERRGWRLALEAVALCVMLTVLVIFGMDERMDISRYPAMWALLAAAVVVGVALPLFAGPGWLGSTALSAALVGRFLPPRVTVVVVGLLVVYTMALPFVLHANGSLVLFALLPVAAAVFPYQTQRRMQVIRELRETRAELARVAVAEERLRIARDLHDLLGHSLSVITLKSELAGRLVEADPERARGEMSEVEAVARRSLGEVREAVTAYRRPTLTAELAAARGTLAAADVAVTFDVAPGAELPDAVNALLAWAVREGVTNVARHSGARHCAIRLSLDGRAVLEIDDDGDGGGTGEGGSGLAGLAERAGRLGGELSAGPRAGGGFRLRVAIPLPAEEER